MGGALRQTGWLLLAAGLVAVGGCELQETTVAEPEEVVVAEVYLRAGDVARQRALLHRTAGEAAVPGARIEVADGEGTVLTFREADAAECLAVAGEEAALPGTCYAAPTATPPVEPGREYTLEVRLPDGGTLRGATRVPGVFALHRPTASACRLPPGTPLEVVWTPSEGTWVYVAETEIRGLSEVPGLEDEDGEFDPLHLTGLSITREDTTIVFPTEFGVFDRFDLPRAVLQAIQDGLPAGTRARILIAAADRNYVNWVRGGEFHPSGLVRTPSITGDGTGVFGSLTVQALEITASDDPADGPLCTAGS